MPRIEAVWEKKARMRRLAQVISIVALIFNFVLLSSLISYSLLLTRERNALKKKIGVYEARVRKLKPVESKHVLLKSKLKELLKIFKIEEKPDGIFKDLETFGLEGIKFLEVNYADGNLKIKGEARDAVVLDELVQKLEDEGRDLFSQAVFDNVNRTTEGDYIFGLSLSR